MQHRRSAEPWSGKTPTQASPHRGPWGSGGSDRRPAPNHRMRLRHLRTDPRTSVTRDVCSKATVPTAHFQPALHEKPQHGTAPDSHREQDVADGRLAASRTSSQGNPDLPRRARPTPRQRLGEKPERPQFLTGLCVTPEHRTGMRVPGPPPCTANVLAPGGRKPPSRRQPGGTHLGDLPPAEVGKALEGQREDVGRAVDGEALAGGDLLLAPGRKGAGKASAPAPRECPHTGLVTAGPPATGAPARRSAVPAPPAVTATPLQEREAIAERRGKS